MAASREGLRIGARRVPAAPTGRARPGARRAPRARLAADLDDAPATEAHGGAEHTATGVEAPAGGAQRAPVDEDGVRAQRVAQARQGGLQRRSVRAAPGADGQPPAAAAQLARRPRLAARRRPGGCARAGRRADARAGAIGRVDQAGRPPRAASVSTSGGSSGSTVPARASSGSSSSGAGQRDARGRPRSRRAPPQRQPAVALARSAPSATGRPSVPRGRYSAGAARARPSTGAASRSGPNRNSSSRAAARAVARVGEREVAHDRQPAAPVGRVGGREVGVELRAQLRVAAPVRRARRRPRSAAAAWPGMRDAVGLGAHHARRPRRPRSSASSSSGVSRSAPNGEEAADVRAPEADARQPHRQPVA